MSIETDNEGGPHRFFHTMVVMGSALALGCGGMSNADEPERTARGGAGGGGGGSGGTGSGGAGSTGGSGGTGGTGILIMPGGNAGQPPVEPGPFTCSPAQWQCDPYEACDGEGFRLPESCTRTDSIRGTSCARQVRVDGQEPCCSERTTSLTHLP